MSCATSYNQNNSDRQISIALEAFSQSPVAQVVIDPFKDTIIVANEEFRRWFGGQWFVEQCRQQSRDQSRDQHRDQHSSALPEKVSDLFVGCLPHLIVFTQEALYHHRAWTDALYLTLPNNEQKRVEVSGRSFYVQENNLLHLCLQDAEVIQQRREAQDANDHYRSGLAHWNRVSRVFQEFERENQLILAAAGEGIYGVDTQGRTTFLNPAAETMLGWKAEELEGKPIHKIIHYHHVDGTEYPECHCPIYASFRDGQVKKVDNEVFWHRSGEGIDVEYTSTPINDNGHLVGAVVIFRDVTQKKRDQQRLVAALREVEDLKHRLELENAYLQEEINSNFNHHKIIGQSQAIKNIVDKIELAAPTDITVLITGESGTGKELIARAIHEASNRRTRSLIRVNCAAIPNDLFESEFFGHTKGAFTGATSDRLGRFELADGGTLFLDEVGEIPLALQAKLLRVLQEQQFERVGEAKTRKVDVRIITATNQDLATLVEQGKFREDLYFRLNVFPVESCPLRKRLDDIPLLAQHFLNIASRKANKNGLKIPLSELDKLQSYHWPGNIRELENLIERQVILARGNIIRFENFSTTASTDVQLDQSAPSQVWTDSDLKRSQRQSLIVALKKSRGKVSGPGGAAELLNIAPTTLSSRLKKHRIDAREFKYAD